MNKNQKIVSASEWAEKLWEESALFWKGRSAQDSNYRKFVTDPLIKKYVLDIPASEPLRTLDLGCGDCSFLNIGECRRRISDGGLYLGVDCNDVSLEYAKKEFESEKIKFLKYDISSPLLVSEVKKIYGGQFNLIVSVFVVQELTGIENFLANLHSLMDENSAAVIVTVHPEFAEWLKSNGRMSENENLRFGGSDVLWRWAGEYPIVNEPEKPFYLPYFHRTVDDYKGLFEKNGLNIVETSSIPGVSKIRQLTELKISPFYSFKNNDYWPGISDGNSGLGFIIRKL